MHIRPHEHLVAWKEAHKLCLAVYHLTSSFPSSERYQLVSQMRRASYSVPMNIAEGNMKRSQKEKMHFFEIAICSLEELHYQFVLSRDLKLMDAARFEVFDKHVQRTSYLLTKLREAIRE